MAQKKEKAFDDLTNTHTITTGFGDYEQKWHYSVELPDQEGDLPSILVRHIPSTTSKKYGEKNEVAHIYTNPRTGEVTNDNPSLLDKNIGDAESALMGFQMGALGAYMALKAKEEQGVTPDKWRLTYNDTERLWFDCRVGNAAVSIGGENWQITPQFKDVDILSNPESSNLAFRASATALPSRHIVNSQFTNTNLPPVFSSPTGRTQFPKVVSSAMHGMLTGQLCVMAEMQERYRETQQGASTSQWASAEAERRAQCQERQR